MVAEGSGGTLTSTDIPRTEGGGVVLDITEPEEADLEREMRDWVDRYGDAVVRYLAVRTADVGVAQELAQETFLRLFLFRRRHPRRSVSAAWLYRVAERLAVDHWRRRRARPETVPLTEPIAAGPDPTEAVALREEVALVLARMPRGERDCLMLFYWADWTVDAIAAELHCPSSTVRVRLHRARARFRRLFGDEGEGVGGRSTKRG
jgi:RNA polymerase sigma-70 factor (ECF subfamily)